MTGTDQWLTEKHYLVCPKGVMFKQMKVMSQRQVFFGGQLAATSADTMAGNAFMCMGNLAAAAPPVSALQSKAVAVMASPGVGLPRMGIPPQLLLFASGPGMIKCNMSALTRRWVGSSPNLVINGHQALLVGKSKLMCPAEAAIVEAKETFWQATATRNQHQLGPIARFAFGFLAGRGSGTMMNSDTAGSPAFDLSSLQANMALMSRLANGTAALPPAKKENAVEESRAGRQLQASGVELTLSIFAAKGETLACFPAGTLVHTGEGLLPIEKIRAGQQVWTFDEAHGNRVLKPVREVYRRAALRMAVVEMENGLIFEVTADHRFYTQGAWRQIGALKPGDPLENISAETMRIQHIALTNRSTMVYNFSVAGNENYFVTEQGILAHNASYN